MKTQLQKLYTYFRVDEFYVEIVNSTITGIFFLNFSI